MFSILFHPEFFHEKKINLIGNGVVLDPAIFKKEVDALLKMGVDVRRNLRISRKAHLILPTHRILDAASEAQKGKEKIGSTLKGIGPAYMDKTGRNGLRVGDIESTDFETRYRSLVDKHIRMLAHFQFDYDLKVYESVWFEGIETMRKMNLVDGEYEINRLLDQGMKVLAEGAQGSLLDIDFGSYPFVTSSNTITAGTCSGLGISPHRIGEVFGIFKAYCTRVGSGPFPTELNDDTGEWIRKNGNEFGATTGRPRRTGWLDIPLLKYSIMLNGVTKLMMMKSDVLSGIDHLKICTSYTLNDNDLTTIPYDIVYNTPLPVYTEANGWKENLTDVATEARFPQELKSYIRFIEEKTGVPVHVVSVGPDRKQTIITKSFSDADGYSACSVSFRTYSRHGTYLNRTGIADSAWN